MKDFQLTNIFTEPKYTRLSGLLAKKIQHKSFYHRRNFKVLLICNFLPSAMASETFWGPLLAQRTKK